jgi:hypothetical protein
MPLQLCLYKKLERCFLVLLIFLGSVVFVSAQEQYVAYKLRISQGGHPVAELSLPQSGEFILTYVHSIHKRPVYEYYRADQGQLVLYELRYDTTSTGMPFDAEGGFRLENGLFIVTMNRHFQSLPLFVSPVPGHGVIIDGHLYLFTEWVTEETALELTVLQ